MCKIKAIAFTAIAVLTSFCISAQVKTHISHITERDGLSYRWTLDIIQDHKGFMWFATYDGLNRYDGKNIITYKHSDADTNSISTSQVFHLAEDSAGYIWTYGIDRVYNRIDPASGHAIKTNRYFRNDSLIDGSGYHMRHFAPLSNGDFVVLLQGKQLGNSSLWKYVHARNAFVHFADISTRGAYLDYFSEHSDGRIWVWGMGIGYFLVDVGNSEVIHFPVDRIELHSPFDVVIPVDKDRNICYPAPSSVEATNGRQPRLAKFRVPDDIALSRISRVRHDNLGGIWMNYARDSLLHLNTVTGSLEVYIAPFFGESMDVRAMSRFFVDQEGACWNGHFYGVARIVNHPPLFTQFLSSKVKSDNPGLDRVSAREIIQYGEEEIIVRSNDYSFYVINIATQDTREIVRRPEGLSATGIPNGVQSSLIGKDGNLWSNQSDWLVRTDISTGLFTVFEGPHHVENDHPRIFEDRSAQLWWCDTKGLYLFNQNTTEFMSIETDVLFGSNNISFIYASYDNEADEIYGTCDGGIFIFNCGTREGSILEIFPENERDYPIMAITRWEGQFWLATTNGLVRFDPVTAERKIYKQADGLPSDIVYSVLGAGNELWLATHSGLCQFDYVNEKMTTYYQEQGLPHNEFNRWSHCRLDSGYLLFGGINGVIGFHPREFSFPNKQLGHLNLLNFSKYDQKEDQLVTVVNDPYRTLGKITIGPSERTLSFKYILPVYENVSGNQYFHYLEGLERSWIEDGSENEASYIQVPPGDYTFRVKARGPTKISALNELAIPFTIQQYWYLRWWAIAMYGIIGVLVVIVIYRFQLNRKLERQEADRIKELEEVKTRLYTNITHEFRTPLTVMLGMNEAVNEYAEIGDVDKVYQSTEMIDRNAKNLLDLVNQMLDLSKLESGMLEVHNRPGDMLAYLRYRLEAFQSYAAEKNIDISFSSTEEDLVMDFDPDRISHIINNLISNAIKFTPDGGAIDVSAEQIQRGRDKDFVELKVRDTGIGIDADKIEHIFERYYQVGHTALRKGEGTGIGLSLVNEIVKLLGGNISVESTPGQGTEFTVLLPIASASQSGIVERFGAKASIKEAKERTELLSTPGVNGDDLPLVLIVEDNADVMHYIDISINHAYQVVTAVDGKEGILKAIDTIPDVVISDVMMPYTDGYQLCETLKKDERTSHIPIILLTAKTDQSSKVTGLEHGADAYLSKPFHQQELLIRLRNLLSLRAEFQKRYASTDYTKPDQGPADPEDAFIRKVRTMIIDHLQDEDFDVGRLCKLVHVSRAQLHRKLTALTGASASQLIRAVQLETARELLAQSELSISEVAYRSGFKTQAHFSRVFSESEGVAPTEYRKKLGVQGS